MTQDEIIAMAEEVYGKCEWSEAALMRLESFAKLVAAHEREACKGSRRTLDGSSKRNRKSNQSKGTTMIEAMKQARQVIWRYRHETPLGNQPHMIAREADEAIERIDQAIAEAEKQEPVAWHESGAFGNRTTHKDWALANGWRPLYNHPQPKREWVGLTAEDWENLEGCEEMRKYLTGLKQL
jgi:hypothetical protein